MVPGNYDITIYRGGTFSVGINAENAAGVAIDFSTYDSVRMQIRPAWIKKHGNSPMVPLLELTTDNGGIEVVTTTLTMFISAADTAALTFNEGRYDLELVTDAVVGPPVVAEVVDKILVGLVKVTGEITL
jgi:hypothetical protein